MQARKMAGVSRQLRKGRLGNLERVNVSARAASLSGDTPFADIRAHIEENSWLKGGESLDDEGFAVRPHVVAEVAIPGKITLTKTGNLAYRSIAAMASNKTSQATKLSGRFGRGFGWL
jgi:hypothetical protein